MEWIATHHLDVGGATLQPHHAAFHPSQPLLAVAVGHHVYEYDILMGCKLATIDVGVPAVRMAYSPAGGHTIIAVLEDLSIKACDLDTEHTHVLYTPEKKTEKLAGVSVEVHIALTPLQPLLFFGAHRQMTVNVVGTIEGTKPVTKIRTDLKKPITDLACHPRSPLLFVAYLDGIVRAYNIQAYSVQYTLQIDSTINTIKLVGAGAIAFHSTLEWVFIGDRSGTLIAWDVSVANRPNMIGITQVGSNAIPTVAWNPMLKLLVTLTKEGNVQAWRTRTILNTNRPPLKAQFFEPAGLEAFDVANIMTQQGGETVYPLPRVKELLVHSKLNLATCLLMNAGKDDESRGKTSTLSREGRKQLFAVLQSARGSPGSVLKEKLAILGSAGILPEQQLQLQMQQARGQSGQPQLTIADLARKAFLHSNAADKKVRTGPISKIPLLMVSDRKRLLRDIPICQPIRQPLRFFNSEQRIFDYPVRVFFMDSCNITAYNLASGEYNIYKKLSSTALGGNERVPTHMIYSEKRHIFLIFFECRGSTSEVVVHRDHLDVHNQTERSNTITGCDGAFVGYHENQYAILEDDGLGLSLHILEEELESKSVQLSSDSVNTTALDANSFSENVTSRSRESLRQSPIHFVFDNRVQRIFSTPLDSSLLYASQDGHLGLAKLLFQSMGVDNEVFEISTRHEDGPYLQLKSSEAVLQVSWQETPSGHVAGVLTTQRVLILSQKLEIISSFSRKFDLGFPPFRSIVWAGPALIFSTATTLAVLGWDGVARPLVTINTQNAALIGFLNDRVLLACPTDSNPRQKQGVEVRIRLVGLLEPLLIGWATMQRTLEPKLDLAELMFQLTSRFDSLRVTPRLLDTLATGSEICGDLAVELALAGPQFTQVLRGHYAVLARRFRKALSILVDEFQHSRDYPRCPPTSQLFKHFRELGRACIRYGQFDLAKETFEVVSDYESLLDLFICHLNPSALRRLSQKLEESGSSPEIQRQCAKILSVRSTSWGQGSFLSNFAAESMLPKGPEWGGGNWEIKSPAQTRSIPQWDLSNEVTAYMKTPNEPIPTIIPDHLGVYLGTLKGKGTVVEVKANALVVNSGVKENGSASVANLKAFDNNTKGATRQGLQELMQLLKGNDEQTKAEQEFKNPKIDDSSSDEEKDPGHQKKITIIINPKGAPVDVNKVKEATERLKLGSVGLPPPLERTRSSTQDLLGSMPVSGPPVTGLMPGTTQISVQPNPTTNSTFLQNASTGSALPPQMMMGMGVTAGPIPEDFFQNTTSAIGTLATFEYGMANRGAGFPSPAQELRVQPGTTATHLMDGPSSTIPMPNTFGAGIPPQYGQPLTTGVDPFAGGVPPARIPTSQESTAAALDPFSGGVPPLGIPPKPGQPIATVVDPFAGGVPPSAQATSSGSTPVRPAPNDVGSLITPSYAIGGIATGTSLLDVSAGKPVARPSSPPIVARPGQIPRGAPAAKCFKTALAHLEQNQLTDAMACFDEGFLALAKDQSLGLDIKAQATICAQYKLAVLLLQEIARLQKVQGPNAISAKDEIARLSRHLSALPLNAKHRTVCIRTAIKKNMDVQNYAFAKSMLELLLSKAPSNKQDELRSLINICNQRGSTDRSIDPSEDPSQFCAATLGRLSTIGHDACNVCSSKFSTAASPICTICGMGAISRSDAVPKGAIPSPFS